MVPEAASGKDLRGLRLLVADDNETNRRILAAQAAAWGMRASTTASSREALEWIRGGERFDIALLDLHMPDPTGPELARLIRESQDSSTLSIVILSSSRLDKDDPALQGADIQAVITKPIRQSVLYDNLVDIIRRRPLQRARPREASPLPPPSARSLEILLAEDDPANKKIALLILRLLGYPEVDVASNGREVVEAISRKAYDAVLMDIRMPEMDGLEAAREITRRWAPDSRPRLIALTANVFGSDREQSFRSGMDDYLIKPIDPQSLAATLERVPKREAEESAAPPASQWPSGIVDEDLGRTRGDVGGAESLAGIIRIYLEQASEVMPELLRAAGAGDKDVVVDLAHRLLPSTQLLGARKLAELLRDLQTARNEDDARSDVDRVAELREEFENVQRRLQAILAGNTGGEGVGS
jgi:CheY-like chemotaxis protein